MADLPHYETVEVKPTQVVVLKGVYLEREQMELLRAETNAVIVSLPERGSLEALEAKQLWVVTGLDQASCDKLQELTGVPVLSLPPGATIDNADADWMAERGWIRR